MLGLWKYIEADFLRDYGLELGKCVREMSWRQFKALLSGLSPGGAVAANYAAHQRTADARRGDAAAAFWRGIDAHSPSEIYIKEEIP